MQLTNSINAASRHCPKWAVYIVGLIPFGLLVGKLIAGNLGADPVKAMEHELGKIGLQLLIAGLVITPLRKIAGINLLKFRRVVGLLAFFYVTMHLLVWLIMDIQLLWGQIWADIIKRPYITIGMGAMVLLIPLAVTSNDRALRRLGPLRWRRLHRLTYIAVVLGAVHFAMVVKGWQVEPFLYLGVALALLAFRVWPNDILARLRST